MASEICMRSINWSTLLLKLIYSCILNDVIPVFRHLQAAVSAQCSVQRIDDMFMFQTSSFKACAIECCPLLLLLLLLPIKLPLIRVVFHLILCQLFSSICSASAHYMPLIVKWCRTKSLRSFNMKKPILRSHLSEISYLLSFFCSVRAIQ